MLDQLRELLEKYLKGERAHVQLKKNWAMDITQLSRQNDGLPSAPHARKGHSGRTWICS